MPPFYISCLHPKRVVCDIPSTQWDLWVPHAVNPCTPQSSRCARENWGLPVYEQTAGLVSFGRPVQDKSAPSRIRLHFTILCREPGLTSTATLTACPTSCGNPQLHTRPSPDGRPGAWVGGGVGHGGGGGSQRGKAEHRLRDDGKRDMLGVTKFENRRGGGAGGGGLCNYQVSSICPSAGNAHQLFATMQRCGMQVRS